MTRNLYQSIFNKIKFSRYKNIFFNVIKTNFIKFERQEAAMKDFNIFYYLL